MGTAAMRRKTCTNCGRRFTWSEWQELPLVAHQCVPEDDDGPEEHREYRNCLCRSTLLVRVGPHHTGHCVLRETERDMTKRRRGTGDSKRDADAWRAWSVTDYGRGLVDAYQAGWDAPFTAQVMSQHGTPPFSASAIMEAARAYGGRTIENEDQVPFPTWSRIVFESWRHARRDPSDRPPRLSSRPPARLSSRPPSKPPSSRPRSMEGNEHLAYLLDRDVRAIGPEYAAAPPAPDVRLFISPYGSYRYVALENGRPVSALQIMSPDDGVRGVIANVYTTPVARRRGWAKKLLEIARQRFREVKHSDDLSPAGEAWKGAVRDPRRRRRYAEEGGRSW